MRKVLKVKETMGSIGAVISYCTNDFRFIGKCIAEAKEFADQIVIAVCDHFFDGTAENRFLLDHTYALHPDCSFVEFSYMPDRIYSRYHSLDPDDPDWPIFWAAATRYIGFHYLRPGIESVLFLDSDEIVEGKSCLERLQADSDSRYEALRFASYLYALRPTFRAKNAVNLPLWVKRDSFAPLTLFNPLERIGAYQSHPGPKRERVVGVNGVPFVHHYSWVRTKEECLWKTRTWSHRHDENWPLLIEEAFGGKKEGLFGTFHEFYEIKTGYFDPFEVVFPTHSPPAPGSHVVRIDQKDLLRKEIEAALFE